MTTVDIRLVYGFWLTEEQWNSNVTSNIVEYIEEKKIGVLEVKINNGLDRIIYDKQIIQMDTRMTEDEANRVTPLELNPYSQGTPLWGLINRLSFDSFKISNPYWVLIVRKE